MALRRFLLILAVATALGAVGGLVHGNDAGVQRTIGNISTPWLLVAVVPAWWTRSAWRGAAIGALATLVALIGFYLALTTTMLGHLGNENGKPFLHLFWFVISANKIWFEAGVVSGPLFGAIGGVLGKTRRLGLLLALSAALLILEPALMLFGAAVLDAVGQAPPDETRPYVAEGVLGLVVAAAGMRQLRRQST